MIKIARIKGQIKFFFQTVTLFIMVGSTNKKIFNFFLFFSNCYSHVKKHASVTCKTYSHNTYDKSLQRYEYTKFVFLNIVFFFHGKYLIVSKLSISKSSYFNFVNTI